MLSDISTLNLQFSIDIVLRRAYNILVPKIATIDLEVRLMEFDSFKKLPESEFDVMCAIWDLPAPVTTPALMKAIGNDKGWRAPTLISFLVRLEERGFIRSEKPGKERHYYPVVERDSYMTEFTRRFLKQYHSNSITSFLDTLAGGNSLDPAHFDELLSWLQARV